MKYTIDAIHDYTNLQAPYKIVINAAYGKAAVIFALSIKTVRDLMHEFDVCIEDVHLHTSRNRLPKEWIA